MRVMFPEGAGGPFLVPGVGLVNGGEPFDWPDSEPPVAGTVPAEGEGGSEDEAAEDEAASGRKASSGKGSAR